MSECSRCGHNNAEGSDFCAECGQFLDWDPAPSASRAAAPTGTARPTAAVPVAGPDASQEARAAVEEAQRAAEEAERIRAEAEERAARESVAAVRTAEETVHRIRSEALARAETLAPPEGGPPPESAAALVATQQAEAEAAERRVALEARKARELAHRRARAEAAEADQRARDAAARASALVARPVAAPDPTITLDRATGLAVSPASVPVHPQAAPAVSAAPAAVAPGVQAVAPGVQAVAPGVQAVRPGAERVPAAVVSQAVVAGGPVLHSGEIPCRTCGEGNDASRRYCRRCGRPMLDDAVPVGPRLRWWQRLLRWLRLRREPSARTSDEFRGQAPPGAGIAAGLAEAVRSVMSFAQMIAVVVVALGIGLSLGPLRSQVTQRIDSVRRVLAPRPRYVKEVTVTGDQKTVGNLVDTHKDTLWTAPSGATVHFVFPKKINLFKVGIEAAPSDPPDRLVLTVTGGKPRTCTLNFTGTSGFESFTCKAKSAQTADLMVQGPAGQATVALAEVEFFEVS